MVRSEFRGLTKTVLRFFLYNGVARDEFGEVTGSVLTSIECKLKVILVHI